MVTKTKKASTAKQTDRKGRVKVGKLKPDKAIVSKPPTSFSGVLVLTPDPETETLLVGRQTQITVKGIVWGN